MSQGCSQTSHRVVLEIGHQIHRVQMELEQRVHRVEMDIANRIHRLKLCIERDPQSAFWGFGTWFDASSTFPTVDSTVHSTDFYGQTFN